MTRPTEHIAVLEGGHVELACFELKGNVYAIDVTHLREIVHWQEATSLPRAPRLIEGVIDLRGTVIPVVDLGLLLAGEHVKKSKRARIVIADVDDLVIGIRVDAAVDVIAVDAKELEPAPELATRSGYDAVQGVLRRPNDAPVLLLSMEHIVESVRLSAYPAGEVS